MTKNIYGSSVQLIGRTPLISLSETLKAWGGEGLLLAKAEFMNPYGSSKDRVALNMIRRAEKNGTLSKGDIIFEPTSGNTGIALAAIGSAMGYKVVIVMPDNMSEERVMLIKAYGGEVFLTPGKEGMNGAIKKARELCEKTKNGIIAGQFDNPANPEAHKNGTAVEIWQDSGENTDVFIAGVGTGGSITGIGEFLKEKNKNVYVVAVEPERSPVLSGGKAGEHAIQGIGAGFIPSVLNTEVIDEIIAVSDEDAYICGAEIGRREGILTGPSGGAALFAAKNIIQRKEFWGKTIVVLLPDGGIKYLSSPLFRKFFTEQRQ